MIRDSGVRDQNSLFMKHKRKEMIYVNKCGPFVDHMRTGIETEAAIVAFSSHLASVAPFPACKLRPNPF